MRFDGGRFRGSAFKGLFVREQERGTGERMQVAGWSVDEIVIDRRWARVALALALATVVLLLGAAMARAEAPPKHHAPPKITGSLETAAC